MAGQLCVPQPTGRSSFGSRRGRESHRVPSSFGDSGANECLEVGPHICSTHMDCISTASCVLGSQVSLAACWRLLLPGCWPLASPWLPRPGPAEAVWEVRGQTRCAHHLWHEIFQAGHSHILAHMGISSRTQAHIHARTRGTCDGVLCLGWFLLPWHHLFLPFSCPLAPQRPSPAAHYLTPSVLLESCLPPSFMDASSHTQSQVRARECLLAISIFHTHFPHTWEERGLSYLL